MEEKGFHPLPQPDEIPTREKEDAMGAYFMMFASLAAGLPLPVINLIAAIIYYYLNRAKSRFVRFHAMQSLLSQLPLSALNAGAVFWAVRIFIYDIGHFSDVFYGYLTALIVANIIYLIFSLIAAVKARKGGFYYFIFFGRYAYEKVYRIDENEKTELTNTPPGL